MVRSLLLTMFGMVVLAGCGGNGPAYTGPTRYSVSGKVTWQGEPIAHGRFALIPEDEKLNPAGADIVDGMYSIPDVKGPNKGAYLVQVFAFKPTGKKVKDADSGAETDELEQIIPAKYNGATELTTSISGADSALNFDLQ
ncbi:MAG: hypothetical protein KDA58_14480 [Planctomycetaceae bacterium]|nr:hypothetical protein [Planctomycetaceae bacterium]